MIAAQGFQESRPKQTTRSRMGAVGIMQLLPRTAADPEIGITRIDKSAERNIEAGTKYLRHLVKVYLDDTKLDEKNRTLMAFAAYNAGPGNLAASANGRRSLASTPISGSTMWRRERPGSLARRRSNTSATSTNTMSRTGC
jgi:membrane-bound lytic murein transglycosylase MltF